MEASWGVLGAPLKLSLTGHTAKFTDPYFIYNYQLRLP